MAKKKDTNKILGDSATALAKTMDEAAIAASNTKAALDLTTDSSTDLAEKQEKLSNVIDSNIDVAKESSDIGTKSNSVVGREIAVKTRYIKTMEDRIALENKLQKERPIVRYSDYVGRPDEQNNQTDQQQLQLSQQQLLVIRRLYDIVGDGFVESRKPVTVEQDGSTFSKESITSGFSATFTKPTTVQLVSNSGLDLNVLDTMAGVLEPDIQKNDEQKQEQVVNPAPAENNNTPVPSENKKPDRESSGESEKQSFFSRVVSVLKGKDSKAEVRSKKQERVNDEAIKNSKKKKSDDDEKRGLYSGLVKDIKGLMSILSAIRSLTLISIMTSIPAIVAMIAAVGVSLGKALYDYKDEVVEMWDRMNTWLGDKLSGWGHDLGKWSGDLISDIVDEMPKWVDSMWSRLEEVFDGFITVIKRQVNKISTSMGMSPVFDDVPEDTSPPDDRTFLEKAKAGLETAQGWADKINPLSGMTRKLTGGIVEGVMDSRLGPKLRSAGDSVAETTSDVSDYIGKKWDAVTGFFGGSSDDEQPKESKPIPVAQDIQPYGVPTSELARVLEQENINAKEKQEQQKEQRAVMATVAAMKSSGGTSVVAPQTNNTYVVGGAGFPGDYAMQQQRLGAQSKR